MRSPRNVITREKYGLRKRRKVALPLFTSARLFEDYADNVQGGVRNNFESRLDASLGKSRDLAYANINQRLTIRNIFPRLSTRAIARDLRSLFEEAQRDADAARNGSVKNPSFIANLFTHTRLCALSLEL